MAITLLDCTLRDGGYYNQWDFSRSLVEDYLHSMYAAQVDVVELGFRFLRNQGFKGPCAYTTDDFVRGLSVPPGLRVAVMLNGADLCTPIGCFEALNKLFPESACNSPVDLVRIACHFHELPKALPATGWLAQRGYQVGLNLMQISERTKEEIFELTRMASDWPVNVLYFADSMGSMVPQDAARITGWLRDSWSHSIGIHTHDNMGLALANTLAAAAEGADWLDATVTGMGRGPGNARTEELVIEAEALRSRPANMVPLMEVVRKHFGPMKKVYEWGTNPYYYFAGKHRIHPTYIQEMYGDTRYDAEDIFSVIDYLRRQASKEFSIDVLDNARNFYYGEPRGRWNPASIMAKRGVLILGAGPGVTAHRDALEDYIRRSGPVVIALNTQSSISSTLIDLRVACHPVRLLADANTHLKLTQPLITPASMLPSELNDKLGEKELLDFGIGIEAGRFEYQDTFCITPTPLVLAYALACAVSGRADSVLLAGFDGYPPGDARNDEIELMLTAFENSNASTDIASITPTSYKRLRSLSVYGL